LLEVVPERNIGAPRRVLLEAINHRLRDWRLVGRKVFGDARIRYVEEQEIYEVNRGGHRWGVVFNRGLPTRGCFQMLRATRSSLENRDDKSNGQSACGADLHGFFHHWQSEHIRFRGLITSETLRNRRLGARSSSSEPN